MLKVSVHDHKVFIGDRLSVSFHRTLRIPNDGQVYPLTPGFGAFPVHMVEDFQNRVPPAWLNHDGMFIPLYQSEALWIKFDGAYWKPNAVQVGVGMINAISGQDIEEELRDNPQNYIVCPDQPWLDGIIAGTTFVRQFVATPLGSGTSVEGQMTGQEEFGGIQIRAYDPKPGIFPDTPPPQPAEGPERLFGAPFDPSFQMGLGVGGKMKQKIYQDPYGIHSWNPEEFGTINVHLLNSEQYHTVTGHTPPPTPIDAKRYAEKGLPWFDLYDEHKPSIRPSSRFNTVQPMPDPSHRSQSKGGKPAIATTKLPIKKLSPAEKALGDVSQKTGKD